MGEINIKTKKRKKITSVIYKIKYPEKLNDKVYGAINSGILDGFLPISASSKKKSAILICTIKDLISLKDFMNRTIDRNLFLDVVLQIINQIKLCDKYLLNTNNLDLHMECIFVEPNTKNIKFIYWPIVNNTFYIRAQDFFRELEQNLVFTNSEDSDYLREYSVFLNSFKAFSLNQFEKLILGLYGKSNTLKMIPDEKNYNEFSKQVRSGSNSLDELAYDPFSITKQDESTLDCNYINNESVILKKAFLQHIKTGRIVKINKSIFTIGKNFNASLCLHNQAISRKHAYIIYENSQFYIVDFNSTNHTYLNNNVLMPNKKFLLVSNSIIRFANEDFMFVLN